MVATTPGVIWDKDRSVVASDGAVLTYAFLGPDQPDQPTVALCSGFLCPDTWWAHLAPRLAADGWRVLIFHYRGIASSTRPTTEHECSYTVERCAADLVEIADAEGIGELVLAGHSMGTQVALEAYRQLPERAVAYVALTGPYASPIRTLYGRTELTYLLYEPVRLLFRYAPSPALRVAWRLAWNYLPFLTIGQAVHAFGPRTSQELVATYVEHAAALDPRLVLAYGTAMHQHSAEDVLPDVAVPALIVVGGKDPFSPPELGAHMAAQMPDAELRTAPNGTHATVLEYPDLVDEWVVDFLDRRVRRPRGIEASS